MFPFIWSMLFSLFELLTDLCVFYVRTSSCLNQIYGDTLKKCRELFAFLQIDRLFILKQYPRKCIENVILLDLPVFVVDVVVQW